MVVRVRLIEGATMRSPSAVVINHKQVLTFLGWVHNNFQLAGVPLWGLNQRPNRFAGLHSSRAVTLPAEKIAIRTLIAPFIATFRKISQTL